jgi:hypothetical protein
LNEDKNEDEDAFCNGLGFLNTDFYYSERESMSKKSRPEDVRFLTRFFWLNEKKAIF